ncbi:MAG: branched-chain amino acid ABC transporter permease [Anaerolineae bacterium]|nr:branched-chain amino acid ABC transporter permease [Anaerolineae bacterium]MCI0610988.1 branched-chain amino acid ABC transporter permease [Anaerolineae bacterium]
MQTLRTIPAWTWGLLAAVALAGLSFVLGEFQLILASQMLIAGLFAMSLNIIMGFGGMVHFGHAAFYGLGAYTVAILAKNYNIPLWVALPLAPVVSAALGAVVGWFCVRRVRLYFSILTLAFGQILYVIVLSVAADFTGGDNGIHGIPVPEIISSARNYYLFTLLIFTLCFVALFIITKAPFVLTLRAIRENAERAQFIGVDVRRHQLTTFIIGSFFAGIAGGLMAILNRFVGPDMLFWTTSSEPILGSLMGGMFSLTGPAVGAALLLGLHLFISQYTEFWPTVLGILTIIVVLAAPTGLVGLTDDLPRAARSAE